MLSWYPHIQTYDGNFGLDFELNSDFLILWQGIKKKYWVDELYKH